MSSARMHGVCWDRDERVRALRMACERRYREAQPILAALRDHGDTTVLIRKMPDGTTEIRSADGNHLLEVVPPIEPPPHDPKAPPDPPDWFGAIAFTVMAILSAGVVCAVVALLAYHLTR